MKRLLNWFKSLQHKIFNPNASYIFEEQLARQTFDWLNSKIYLDTPNHKYYLKCLKRIIKQEVKKIKK